MTSSFPLLQQFYRSTFRRQLAILFSAGVLCVSLLAALATSWQGSRQLHTSKLHDGLRIAHNLALQSRLALVFGSADNVSEAVSATSAFPDVARIEIRHADGRLLLERGTPLNAAEEPVIPQPTTREAYLDQESGDGWRFLAPVWSQSSPDSPFDLAEQQQVLLGYVVIEQSKSTLNALVREVFMVNFASGIAFAALFMLALRLLANRLTRPLASLSDTMARAELGETGLRAEVTGPRDLADMAHAFNSMMEALEQREQELRTARDSALRFAKLKADFAATVSHEIRTPLNGVIGTLEMLRQGRLEKNQQDLLGLAWDSSHYLLELVNNILDFSRLEAGRMEVEANDFELAPLIDGVIRMFLPQASGKGIALSSSISSEVPRYINGDPSRIRQVLINLVGNALKFTDSGAVTLTLQRHPQTGNLDFGVRDTGIGITPEQQAVIFDSFTQADTSTTRRYGGSGLGLSICKQIIHLLGGEIGVDSQPGMGSCFWFSLPCVLATSIPAKQPVPTAIDGQRKLHRRARLLIVEDNRTNQLIATGMLEMLGCSCGIANNGQEAIELWRQETWDLILMDCSMPVMDGFEATSRIRQIENDSRQRIPIIAMTANTLPEDVAHCLEVGMDDHLSKPLSLDSLTSTLNRWLSPAASSDEPPVTSASLPVSSNTESFPAAEAAAAASAPAVLDRETLNHLRQILGDSLGAAIRPFLEDAPRYLLEMESAITADSPRSVQQVAHTLKGAAGNIGATAVANVAREIEALARTDSLEGANDLLIHLRTELAIVEPMLTAELGEPPEELPSLGDDAPKVLIVDDDRATRSALRLALRRSGFEAQEVADGAEALLWLQRHTADAILMDAMMPVMDGFTACNALKQHPQWKDIPVLMITALDDRQTIERAFEAGASDFIPKPIHMPVVNQRVRRLINATRAERSAQHLASTDPLTALPNRPRFVEQLNLAIERAQANNGLLAVLFLDLDRFKFINDTLGHEAGDELLVTMAQRLKACVRTDDCVARLGGDEFAILLDDLPNPGVAGSIAQNICRSLAIPLSLNGQEMVVTASVGISVYPSDGTDVSSLLRHADAAMYRAKHSGSGFCYYETGMESAISDRLKMENDLRRALERNEITVFYQPVIDTASGDIHGLEALVRWLHPEQGLVSPAEFIPVAEDTGLILPIGEYVLRTACQQVKSWLDAGCQSLHVAVNLSAKQLEAANLLELVQQILEETQLPTSALVLEITESVLVNRERNTLNVLDDLRQLGILLSIDDFGTGYSSLSYLKHLPADTLKIDRSFIQDMPDDEDAVAIVTGIMALAHSLRLSVVAEGVETAAQQDTLTRLKCDSMQGYYFSKPLPAEVIETRLLGSRRVCH